MYLFCLMAMTSWGEGWEGGQLSAGASSVPADGDVTASYGKGTGSCGHRPPCCISERNFGELKPLFKVLNNQNKYFELKKTRGLPPQLELLAVFSRKSGHDNMSEQCSQISSHSFTQALAH